MPLTPAASHTLVGARSALIPCFPRAVLDFMLSSTVIDQISQFWAKLFAARPHLLHTSAATSAVASTTGRVQFHPFYVRVFETLDAFAKELKNAALSVEKATKICGLLPKMHPGQQQAALLKCLASVDQNSAQQGLLRETIEALRQELEQLQETYVALDSFLADYCS
eukprot:6898259-Prymnesium_polylepis.1